jgi:hypothetical protein
MGNGKNNMSKDVVAFAMGSNLVTWALCLQGHHSAHVYTILKAIYQASFCHETIGHHKYLRPTTQDITRGQDMAQWVFFWPT